MLDNACGLPQNAGMQLRGRSISSHSENRWGRVIAQACAASFTACALFVGIAPAADRDRAPAVIERIPHTVAEVDAAHEKSDHPCMLLPAGVAIVSSMDRQTIASQNSREKRVPGPSTAASIPQRTPVVSFGTRMTDADLAELPYFSGRTIRERIDNNYLSLQARVGQGTPGAQPFLDCPLIAGVGAYGKPNATVDFASLQKVAVNNVRCLGLFVKPGAARTPEALRTLVISTKGSRVEVPDDQPDAVVLRPALEMMFVRLHATSQPAGVGVTPNFELHAFGTADELSRLLYFSPYAAPAKISDCSIASTIRITEYSLGGQSPSARATRQQRFNARGDFSLAALDKYAADAGLAGGALDNLNEILDAIIVGKIKATAK